MKLHITQNYIFKKMAQIFRFSLYSCFLFFVISFSFMKLVLADFKLAPEERKNNKIVYKLTIDYKNINLTGQDVKAMAINDSIPAPTLYFKEGERVVIYVTNKMKEESSIHWHGILLPNFEDGVPYLTSPPIQPGKTHKFEFVINQPPGTYWYHSHTGLQEQRGLYGAIVIEPKRKNIQYDKDLVLILSDWTDENPKEVLQTLKRGSEWYAIEKDTLLSLFYVIKKGALGAQLKMWKQRMPGIDISDIYYPAFLVNGKTQQHYPQFKSGEKIRVRVINSSASTYFWLSFGGKTPLLVSADGVNVQPVPTKKKQLHAIAETYDFLLTVPLGKAVEFKATAQDGSGVATAVIGKGEVLKAPLIPKPDLIKALKDMAEHHSHSGMHHSKQKNKSHSDHSSHNMDHKPQSDYSNHHIQKEQSHSGHSNHGMSHKKMQNKHSSHIMNQEVQNPSGHVMNHETQSPHASHSPTDHTKPAHKRASQKLNSYDHLKSSYKTNFSNKNPVKKITMNLTGNMWRYVWSINGKTLSETDKIKIQRGEVVQITLKNNTMMHHPMHLHGHFFRVLNKNGQHSPLKHTVDVPPMDSVTIEFLANEKGDWFFHCHVLYHMESGMARVFSYGDPRDKRLKKYPESFVMDMDKHWYKWGEVDLMSHRADLELVMSNTRNRVTMEGVFSWFDHKYKPSKNFEVELEYEYFLSDFFRLYGGVELENEERGILGSLKTAEVEGKLGFKYLLPYFFDLTMSLSHKAELELSLDYELMLLSRLEFFSEWKAISEFSNIKNIKQEWQVGLEYLMSQKFSLISSYDNRFGWGAGLHLKF